MNIYNQFTSSLIENIEKPSKPKEINLILDGGAFKGAYLCGALLYFKQLEKMNYIKINKLSGTSIGALLGVLYLTDQLHLFNEFYPLAKKTFTESLKFDKLYQFIYSHVLIKKNSYKCLHNKLYVNYFDTQNHKEIVKSTYDSNDDVVDCIKRTTHLPLLSNGELCYQSFIDGFAPHLFFEREIGNKKNIIINLHSVGNIKQYVNTKKENNCSARILFGILDAHHFYCNEEKTVMCSYLDNWNIKDYLFYRSVKSFRLLCSYLIFLSIFVDKIIPSKFKNNIFIQQMLKSITDIIRDGFIYYVLN